MIIHCTRKLAPKLRELSAEPVREPHALQSWHAHLYRVDRRQCLLFCHDDTRFALFLPGVRKPHFADLATWFRSLFGATLSAFGCSEARVGRALLTLGPCRFDTATDRSVLSSMNILFDHEVMTLVERAPHVLDHDPVAASCRASRRPTWIHGKPVWPDKRMLELVEGL